MSRKVAVAPVDVLPPVPSTGPYSTGVADSTELTAPILVRMILNGGAMLIRNSNELNVINLFPVPDGDTGDNMAVAFKGISKGLARSGKETSIPAVARTTAARCIMAACGNSGTVLTFFFNKLAVELKRTFESAKLAADAPLPLDKLCGALQGVGKVMNDAYENPVEGTIITVIRDGLRDLGKRDETFSTLGQLMAAWLAESEKALARTPEQLIVNGVKILKKAGVVDSGAKGFVYWLKGATEGLLACPDPHDVIKALSRQRGNVLAGIGAGAQQALDVDAHASALEQYDPDYRFCTEFLITLKPGIKRGDVMQQLKPLGNSLVPVLVDGPDNRQIAKVHIHSSQPDNVFERAVNVLGDPENRGKVYGGLLKAKVEDMGSQTACSKFCSELLVKYPGYMPGAGAAGTGAETGTTSGTGTGGTEDEDKDEAKTETATSGAGAGAGAGAPGAAIDLKTGLPTNAQSTATTTRTSGGSDSKVQIVICSTNDLSETISTAFNVITVRMNILLNAEAYMDGAELTRREVQHTMRTDGEASLKTSAFPSARCVEALRLGLSRCQEVLFIHIAWSLSKASGANYRLALEELAADERKRVTCYNTKGVAAVEGIFALRAIELAARGLDAASIVARLDKEVSPMVQHSAGVITDVSYLIKGGRLAGAKALVAKKLGMSLVLGFKNGEMYPAHKALCCDTQKAVVKKYKKALARNLRKVLVTQCGSADHPIDVMITGNGRPDVHRHWESFFRAKFKVRFFLTGDMSGALAVHAGPDPQGAIVSFAPVLKD